MPTGLVALVVVGVWLAYFVPAGLRNRQRMSEARTEDRFSGELRIVAVGGGPAVASTPVRVRADQPRASRLLAGSGQRPSDLRREKEGTMEADTHRAARLAARRAAARRRSMLAGALAALTVLAALVAALTAVPAGWVALPAALLALVLVAGARTVRAQRAADAAAAERAARAAVERAQPVHRPGPRPATGSLAAAVVARAAVASRREPVDSEVAVAAEPAAQAGAEEVADDGLTVWSLRPSGVAGTASGVAGTADRPQPREQQTLSAAPRAPRVPRPAYATKASAAAWEPAPLSSEIARVVRRRERWDAEDGVVVSAAQVVAGQVEAEQTGEPAEVGLAGSLDDVLARRRAAGA